MKNSGLLILALAFLVSCGGPGAGSGGTPGAPADNQTAPLGDLSPEQPAVQPDDSSGGNEGNEGARPPRLGERRAADNRTSTGDNLQENFIFDGSELAGDFHLQQDIQEPVFEWREVDSTCTRQVLDGYDTKCHTEYENECHQEHKCHTEYEQECRQERKCRTEYENQCRNERKCHTEYENECRTERECRTEYENECRSERKCRTEYENECRNERRCHTTNEQVCENRHVPGECHTERKCPGRPGTNCRDEEVCTPGRNERVCHNVPRERCENEPVCHRVPRERCENENVCNRVPRERCDNRQRCERVPRERCGYENVCESVPREKCGYENVCQNVPRQKCGYENVCENVPKQKCEQVPRYRDEEYTCKKKVQVPVGTKRRLLVSADVAVEFSQPPAGVTLNEEFELKLENEELSTRLVRSSGQAILFGNVQKSVNNGDKLKAIRAKWQIQVVGLQSLLAPITGGIANLRVEAGAIKFQLLRVNYPDYLVAGVVLSTKKPFSSTTQPVFTGDLKGSQLILANVSSNATEVTIPLVNLGTFKPGKYRLDLTVKPGPGSGKPLNNVQIPDVKTPAQLDFNL